VPAKDWAVHVQSDGNGPVAECFVTRIEHLKCENGKEHEFLLITVQHRTGNNRPTTQLVTDRCVRNGCSNWLGDFKRSSQILSNGSSASTSSPRINSASPSPSLPEADADDRVHCGKIERPLEDLAPYKPLRTLEFHGATFPVTSLAILLTIVSLERPEYRADEAQCYWYANTIYMAAFSLFHGAEKVDAVHGESRGKYLHVPIRQSDSVSTVTEKYDQALKDYKEQTETAKNTVSSSAMLFFFT